MTTTRRHFLKLTAVCGSALALGFDASADEPFAPNLWVRIDADGTVTLNGERVPAERALGVLMRHVHSSGLRRCPAPAGLRSRPAASPAYARADPTLFSA